MLGFENKAVTYSLVAFFVVCLGFVFFFLMSRKFHSFRVMDGGVSSELLA